MVFLTGLGGILFLSSLGFFLRSLYHNLIDPLGPSITNAILGFVCFVLSGIVLGLAREKKKSARGQNRTGTALWTEGF